ncbi:MAG: 30S ribosomal protein S2 [Bacilli bacterium]|nr:30S ribosomal protein S2 [Bacilli bacterium]
MSGNENIAQEKEKTKNEEENKNEDNIIKIQSVTLRNCLSADCHFGTTNRKRNKKMSSFICAFVNGINIINLNKTIIKMKEAYQAAYDITKNGGKILFINKNEKAEKEIIDDADRSGSFYIVKRWLGGTFTNFKVIRTCSRKLKKLERDIEDNAIQDLSKKEQALIHKKIFKMSKNLEGIKDMIKLPQAVFITNPNDNKIAVKEAKDMNIKVFAIANTDCNPDNIDFIIPANNNSVNSIKLISNLISDAIVSAKCGLKNITFEENNNNNTVRLITIRDAKEKIAKKISAIRAAKKEKHEHMLNKTKMRKINDQKKENDSTNESEEKKISEENGNEKNKQ